MQKIKDKLICFMIKRHRKKRVIFLFSLLFCLFAPAQSAYPFCDDFMWGWNIFPAYGCYDYIASCTSEAEVLDIKTDLTGRFGFTFVKVDETVNSACYTYSQGACIAISICYTEFDSVVTILLPCPCCNSADPCCGIPDKCCQTNNNSNNQGSTGF